MVLRAPGSRGRGGPRAERPAGPSGLRTRRTLRRFPRVCARREMPFSPAPPGKCDERHLPGRRATCGPLPPPLPSASAGDPLSPPPPSKPRPLQTQAQSWTSGQARMSLPPGPVLKVIRTLGLKLFGLQLTAGEFYLLVPSWIHPPGCSHPLTPHIPLASNS